MASSTDAVSAVPGQERLVDQAYRQIRDAIVAVRLQPGAPLDEKALSASLGLGLTPIRDALKRLTLEKLAVTYPRRGPSSPGSTSPTRPGSPRSAWSSRAWRRRSPPSGRRRRIARRCWSCSTTWSTAVTSAPTTPNSTPGCTGRSTRPPATSSWRPPSTSTSTWPCGSGTYCLQEQLAGDEHIRSQRAVVEAIVRGDAPAARMAAEQHLLGFSEDVRSAVLATRW